VFEVDRVILSIDFDNKTFNWLQKEEIRDYKAAGFNTSNFHEAFLDACLLAGGIYDCPVFPNLAGSLTSIGPVFVFERAVDSIRTYSNGLAVINELAPDNQEYIHQFARAKGIITYMPIIADNGCVETMSKKTVPNNIAILITPRLANEVYFYLSRRLVGRDVYTTILSERLHVQAPMDGGDSHEYRRLLSDMMPLRVLCLSLLSGHSHRFMQQKRLVVLQLLLLI
jgi:hypothetical protein